jgi:hypothetical protein
LDSDGNASPAHRFFAGGVTGATAGLSDVAGRAVAGPTWDANRAALSATNPTADLAGNVAGQVGFEGLLGKLAGGASPSQWPAGRILLWRNDGRFGKPRQCRHQRGKGRGCKHARRDGWARRSVGRRKHAFRRQERASPVSRQSRHSADLGQIARGSENTLGHAVGGIEERMAGMPVADAIIGTASRAGDVGFNNEMFRQIAPGVKSTGAEGLAQARAAEQAAYAKLGPVRIPVPTRSSTNGVGRRRASGRQGLNHHAKDVQTVIKDVRSRSPTARSPARATRPRFRRSAKPAPRSTMTLAARRDALDALETEVMGLGASVRAGRSGRTWLRPMPSTAGSRLPKRAEESAQPEQRRANLAATLNQASIRNTEKFGGIAKALSPSARSMICPTRARR